MKAKEKKQLARQTRFRALVVLLVCVGGGLLAFAYFSLRETTVTYSGVVIDMQTGRPIANAIVGGMAFQRGEFAPSMDSIFRIHQYLDGAETDDEGRFEFTLKGYSHTLRVVAFDYVVGRQYMVQLEGFPRGPGNTDIVGSGTPYLDARDPKHVIIWLERE